MAFSPKKLSPTIYDLYKKGVGHWVLTVNSAIAVGYRDLDLLTNIVFYLHYPDLKGRPLKAEEKALINSWQAFRTIVKAMLKGQSTTSSKELSIDKNIESDNKLGNFELQDLM